ncbi:hypothetical protein E5F05_03395 (plasmid) [Deinococcus metallilatus]|uniref:Uncharacterized protein n=1 Tax=Deinococcus metallilatus TaxID=1211322 RepID=A0AAJ5F5J6_9DEIO|nr:hypothetical protein [Deinococcus metallilatus]MBB5297278.1 hypothetical protein [Deinococcus metallilatus]QBY06975.1 hypothetical protein E5F05_03395 [Deinococcus metallilatus]TLK31922.1 hypothetical protein FCS05_00160 [Deinococcus metallilatus]GMA17158.1 hypothetical protein GCM10025871_34890 [Deinococcus metallilatus]
MPYRLTIEEQSNAAVEHFQRDFPDLLDAKRYAHNQVRGDIYWTVRGDHLDGLAPSYALRIEAVGEDAGKPLDLTDDEPPPADNKSLFTPEGPVEEGS